MELNTKGYQKSEIVIMAEQLYGYKAQKKALELELSNEKFHQKYVPKKKKKLMHENTAKLFVIIPLLLVAIGAIYMFFYVLATVQRGATVDKITGVMFLASMLYLGFGGFALVRLLITYCHNSLRLANANINPFVKWLCKVFNIENIRVDERFNNDSIYMLNQKIEELTAKIAFMENQYNDILDKIKEGNLWASSEDTQATTAQDGKFTLRVDSRGSMDLRELFDVYSREEKLCRDNLNQIDTEIVFIDRKRADINDEYENAKQFIIMCIMGFFVFIMLQGIFIKKIDGLLSGICFIGGLFFFYWIEKKCTKAFLDYWIEHDYHVVKNYMFYNSIIPLYAKRELLVEQKEFAEKELEEIIVKKMALESDNPEFS